MISNPLDCAFCVYKIGVPITTGNGTMKKINVKSTRCRSGKQHCVKYHPAHAQEARPPLDPIWNALGTYHARSVGEKTRVPIGTAYKTLKAATSDLRARYPHLRIEILESGREMFPTN